MDNWIAYNVDTAAATGGIHPSEGQNGKMGQKFLLMKMTFASIWKNLIMGLHVARSMKIDHYSVGYITA